MAKRLLDGTANDSRYSRLLVATAGLTVALRHLRAFGSGFPVG